MKYRVVANGWIEKALISQMNELTRCMDNVFYPYTQTLWEIKDIIDNVKNDDWKIYLQQAQWLDDYLRCAILLDKKECIQKASDIIYTVINYPDKDGYLGPSHLKKTTGCSHLPHAVFFRTCIALYDYNKDINILERLERHYLNCKAHDYDRFKDILNIEIMLLIYERNPNRTLLALAERLFNLYHDSIGKKTANEEQREKTLSCSEYAKLGIILYNSTGNVKYLKSALSEFDKIDEYIMLKKRYQCIENVMPPHDNVYSFEDCEFSDYISALYSWLRCLHEIEFSDKIELCVFNAQIGCALGGHRRLKASLTANQLTEGQSNISNHLFDAPWEDFSFNLDVKNNYENINYYISNYLLSMWEYQGDAIYAHLYGPSTFCVRTKGKIVTIFEKTKYPLENDISFNIKTEVSFVCKFRIPKWCADFTISIDGTVQEVEVDKQGYAAITIEKPTNIHLILLSKAEILQRNNDVFLKKGSLLYVLDSKEQ